MFFLHLPILTFARTMQSYSLQELIRAMLKIVVGVETKLHLVSQDAVREGVRSSYLLRALVVDNTQCTAFHEQSSRSNTLRDS